MGSEQRVRYGMKAMTDRVAHNDQTSAWKIESLQKKLCQAQKVIENERHHLKDLQWNYDFLCIEHKKLKKDLRQAQNVIALKNKKINDLQSKLNLLHAIKNEAKCVLPYFNKVKTERNKLKDTVERPKNEIFHIQRKVDSVTHENPLQEASSSPFLRRPGFAVMDAKQGDNGTSITDNGKDAIQDLRRKLQYVNEDKEQMKSEIEALQKALKEAKDAANASNMISKRSLGEDTASHSYSASPNSEGEETLCVKEGIKFLQSRSRRYMNTTSILASAGIVAAAAFLWCKFAKSS